MLSIGFFKKIKTIWPQSLEKLFRNVLSLHRK